jgi:hypothetical protein
MIERQHQHVHVTRGRTRGKEWRTIPLLSKGRHVGQNAAAYRVQAAGVDGLCLQN